jgi:hypothetical protein
MKHSQRHPLLNFPLKGQVITLKLNISSHVCFAPLAFVAYLTLDFGAGHSLPELERLEGCYQCSTQPDSVKQVCSLTPMLCLSVERLYNVESSVNGASQYKKVREYVRVRQVVIGSCRA